MGVVVGGERLFLRDASVGPNGRIPVEGTLMVGDGERKGFIHYTEDGQRLPFWVEPGAGKAGVLIAGGTQVTVEGDQAVALIQAQARLQPALPFRKYHPKDGDPVVGEVFLPRGTGVSLLYGDVTVTEMTAPIADQILPNRGRMERLTSLARRVGSLGRFRQK